MSKITPELQKQIENEAIDATKACKDTDFDIGWNQGYEKGYEAAGEKYALKWQEAEQRAARYEKALKAIRDWQLPDTGKFWNDPELTPMSYEACYGSNGVRDYMRALANEALTPKQTTDDTVNG